jgi:hypothetical protein
VVACGGASPERREPPVPSPTQPSVQELPPGGSDPSDGTTPTGADAAPAPPPAPVASAATPGSTSVAAPNGPEPAVGLSASVAMVQSGSLDPKALVAEVNQQRGPLQACGRLVRAADRVVGSLNLQVVVDQTGHVTPDLQSPVSPEARACLLRAAGGWRVRAAGSGEAMLLLVLDDAVGP